MTQRGHEPEAFEPTDWEARPIRIAAVALAVFISLALAMSALTIRFVRRYRSHVDEPTVFASKHVPPTPRLQVDEESDLAAYRRRQNGLLSTYGWIDRDKGVVRLPIERAMDIVAREYQGRKR
jgi:hypothetical protein